MRTISVIADVSDSDFRQLADVVLEAMQHFHVPGVVLGLWHDGAEHTAGFGVTSIEHPLPVTADTLAQIGSITKTFTGTLAMRLVEMGQLELDTPIKQYLPEFELQDKDVEARVTLRHLFTHMGGWVGDYFDDLGPGDDALAKYVAKMAELPQVTPLNTIWSYNNAGFSLAGRVIEVVTGKTYEAAMQELVFDPLGLKLSFFFPNDVMTHRFMAGHIYSFENDPLAVARPWALARTAHAAGAITSTVKDLLRYARFHMGQIDLEGFLNLPGFIPCQ